MSRSTLQKGTIMAAGKVRVNVTKGLRTEIAEPECLTYCSVTFLYFYSKFTFYQMYVITSSKTTTKTKSYRMCFKFYGFFVIKVFTLKKNVFVKLELFLHSDKFNMYNNYFQQ